jgi:PAS domain S-box-containing protein
MIEGKALGLLGLANKPGGFTENDAHLASGFGELAAISLLNSRIWESLQHSEASYRTLVEASPDGVLALDADGQIIDCNEGLCQLLGYEKVKVKGNDIQKFLPAAMPAELTAQLRHKGRLEAEFEAVRQDGQTVTVWAKGVARVDKEGKLSQTVLYIRDIAERKKLDELKDELIGLVSHEIRTPLTVIMGGLNTLLSEETRLSPEEKRQLLQDAALETNSLSYLLGDLIELSRAQANRLSLNLEPVAIRSVIKGVVGKLEQQTSAHRFVIDLPPRLPMVQADPIRIERILHNLLENAVKYSPRGGEIRVLAKRDGNHLVIGVRDQGVGISQADQTKLFIPFERLENRGLEEVKGAGLGLMVCRRLVEAHGGRIWVESQPSRGSTFFFTLPFSKAGT